MAKVTVASCPICRGKTDQFLIKNQWMCASCGCKYDFNVRRWIPLTTQELTLLDNAMMEHYGDN